MFEGLLTMDALVAFLTLTLMEIVLGIDNIVFIAILCGKLPAEKQGKARTIGLALALISRILLLLGITWVMKLTTPLFTILGTALSGKDLILLGGGAFLVAKATHEIYDKLEVSHADKQAAAGRASFASIVMQIMVLDVVFSLDSVITAVGMAQQIPIMVAAVIVAIGVMLVFAGRISGFIDRHPSMKILALSFLLLIGVMLGAEGLHHHMPKGYIYSAMAFSIFVELLNMRFRARQKPVKLHSQFEDPAK